MSKYLCHVPTESFGFISVEVEGEAQDAVLAYKALSQAWNGGSGVGIKALAGILVELLNTGGIENGGNYDFSQNEGLLVSEVSKLLRKSKRK